MSTLSTPTPPQGAGATGTRSAGAGGVRFDRARNASEDAEERLYLASQWRLMWIKFRRHKLAMTGVAVAAVFYVLGAFCEVVAPYDPRHRHSSHTYVPPQLLRFYDSESGFSLRPFVYRLERHIDARSLRRTYTEDRSQKYYLTLFHRGQPYTLWGLFETDLHLFGVEGEGTIFLLGTDRLGRDMLSRIAYGARISLSIGLIGVTVSLVLGLILGGVSGYYGGTTDTVVQRVIEMLRSFPTIPLWLALAAALPLEWGPVQRYFAITVILSVIGWTGLARVVRGKLLAARGEDFVTAALVAGTSESTTIRRHLLPSFMSHIIVSVTLSIPGMILAETGLSFLGLGLLPPVISWGVLLKEAQNVTTVALNPWLLLPAIPVVLTVLAFNFVGDGLRDAADPYKT